MEEGGVRAKMSEEYETKEAFLQAQKYCFEFADQRNKRNVFPTKQALHNLKNFDERLPEEGSDILTVLKRIHEDGSPATVEQTGGRYFGFVNGGVVPAGLAVKLLTDFWDQNTALYLMSPVASKLESVVEDWLNQLFFHTAEKEEEQQKMVAGFVSGSSVATFCGVAAGRYRLLERAGWDVNAKGLYGAPRIRVIASAEAHRSVFKVVSSLGLGTDSIEVVDCDEQGRIIPELVPSLDSTCILVLQAGNVHSGSFDNFEILCEKAHKARAWVHIDGAFGLWAGATEKLKHLTEGMEKADSLSVDGHKTLNTPYDCGIVLCKDRSALSCALTASASYITYDPHKRDGMCFTPEMSRRARIVELWATMCYLGSSGIDDLVYGLHHRAAFFAQELARNGFEVLNDVVFNQVTFHYKDNETTDKLLENIQNSGVCWCGGSTWKGKKVIRISVCSWATTFGDVSTSVDAFVQAKAMLPQ